MGSAFPGVGTVAVGAIGAVSGFAIGFAITTVGNTVFDAAYDNWDTITSTAKEIGTTVVDEGKKVVDGIGNAISSAGDWLGSAFAF